jgi:hypothetical protein
MRTGKESCEKCYFWECLGIDKAMRVDYGFCRRSAPVRVLNVKKDELAHPGHRAPPCTWYDDWCGEWKECAK